MIIVTQRPCPQSNSYLFRNRQTSDNFLVKKNLRLFKFPAVKSQNQRDKIAPETFVIRSDPAENAKSNKENFGRKKIYSRTYFLVTRTDPG